MMHPNNARFPGPRLHNTLFHLNMTHLATEMVIQMSISHISTLEDQQFHRFAREHCLSLL